MLSATTETFLTPILGACMTRFRGNWSAVKVDGKIPLQPLLNNVFKMLLTQLGPSQSRLDLGERLAGLIQNRSTVLEYTRAFKQLLEAMNEQQLAATESAGPAFAPW